jgi:2-succinyl-6-hydroxy-2,4-cyclohexadiene-1-carboxylate synthase
MITLGDSQHPALIFLHGFMGTGEDWRALANHFTDRFYCVLPDLPGHGTNIDHDPEQPLTFDQIAYGVRALLDTNDLKHPTLVGYSLGGRAALYTAIRFPHRFHALVLEGPNPGIPDENARTQRATLDDQRGDKIEHDLGSFIEHWYDMPLFAGLHRDPARLAAMKTRRKQNNPFWAAKAIRDFSPGRMPDLWPRLSEITLPTLLIAGADDAKYSQIIRKMAETIPNAQTAHIPGAGHNAHHDQTYAFIQVLDSFFSRVYAK